MSVFEEVRGNNIETFGLECFLLQKLRSFRFEIVVVGNKAGKKVFVILK